MKKINKFRVIFLLFVFVSIPAFGKTIDPDKFFDLRQNAFALYNTSHTEEAYDMLKQIPDAHLDEEIYLILANIEEDRGSYSKATDYLKSAIQKNPKFYKAYYNLGCIYMKGKIYTLAIDNFELAVKYNEKNPFAYYNLGCAQMNLGEFKEAKKNFIRAICLKNDEKDFYYNLAYVNKKLGKEKDSKKIIDFYNNTFIK